MSLEHPHTSLESATTFSGYAPGGPGQRVSALVAVVTRDVADGNETYTFTLQESSDNSSFAACGAACAIAATGVTIVKGVVTKRYVRLVLIVAGTTPSITYKAWLNPLP